MAIIQLSKSKKSRRMPCLAIALSLMTIPLLLAGCQPSSPSSLSESGEISSVASPSKVEAPLSQDAGKGAIAQKITFRKTDGTPEFSLQFKSTGGKLLDPSGSVIANLILESDGAIRLTDTSNATVGYVVRDGDALSVESPKRTKTLFSFERQNDGNATLTRNDGSVVYQLTATEGGYTVKSDKAMLYTALSRKGSGQLQTGEGQTVIATDKAIVPAAIASFGFNKLTQAQQAGLAYALSTEPSISQ